MIGNGACVAPFLFCRFASKIFLVGERVRGEDIPRLRGKSLMSSTPKFRRESSGASDLRAPPHSIEAEQAVIGGLMLDRVAWDNVGDVVTADDFYRPDHRIIFESIAALAGEAQPCDPVTVSEHLQRLGKLQEVGGLAYLGTLTRDTPGAANARAYAEIVKERALLRALVTTGGEIAGSVWSEEGESARDLVEKAERRIFAIAEGSARGKGYTSARQALPALIDQIDDLYNNPNKPRGLPTGFIDFDSKTGGLRGGDLLIIAGRPSMGKSTLAINMAEHAALKEGIRASVAIFSLEMPAEQILTRMLSSVGSVNLSNIRSGKLSEDDWPRITGATKQLQDAKIFIDDTPALTPTELRARSRRIKREHGLDLIVVDYLQLMSVPGTKENRATEISEISRGLKALAKEINCPVIALSQLNRGVEQRESKKPVMSDLRESGAIEQDADMILLIYRDEVYNKDTPKKGVADIDLAKHRNGETGDIRLTFRGQHARFENYADPAYGEGIMR
jgi:replicative DNA helicase